MSDYIGVFPVAFLVFGLGILVAAPLFLRRVRSRVLVVTATALLLAVAVFVHSPIARLQIPAYMPPPMVFTALVCTCVVLAIGLSAVHRFASLPPVVVMLLIVSLFVSGFSLQPIYGWGTIAIPPFLMGILVPYAISAEQRGQAVAVGISFTLCHALLLPLYMSEMDAVLWQQTRRSSDASMPTAEVGNEPILYTVGYLIVVSVVMLVAWLIGKKGVLFEHSQMIQE